MKTCVSLLATGMVMLSACSQRPDHVLSEAKMADVLADLSIADQLALKTSVGSTDLSSDSARKVLRQSIMKANGVSEADFDSTLNWYGHHMDDYSNLYLKVEQRLAKKQTALNKKAGVDVNDANNLWPLPSMIAISDHEVYPGVSFSIPGNKVKPGQQLKWHMNVSKLQGMAIAFLGAEYPDMEMTYTRMPLSGDKSSTLHLHLMDRRTPIRIFGYVHFSTPPAKRVFIDSIYLTASPASTTNFQEGTVNQMHLAPLPY